MMLRSMSLCMLAMCAAAADTGSGAGEWKTWVIASAKQHGVPPPPGMGAAREELDYLRALNESDSPGEDGQIRFWDAGPPSYRWMELIAARQNAGRPIGAFPRAYAYVSMAVYDATVAAWEAKRTYRRPRPSRLDPRVRPRVAVPRSWSYPSDYAATAAAAAGVLAYLVPAEAAYFHNLAEEAGKSRVRAAVEYPSDYEAGLELGRRVAAQVIAKARADGSDATWSGTVPTGRCAWTGTNPGNATAAQWKPLLLASPAEFRPPAPPSCESPEGLAQIAVVRSFPRAPNAASFQTNARALYWQTAEGIYPWAVLQLGKWLLEDRFECDPPRAARAYALLGTVGYDAFIASQDGKYAYWYLRPAQMDPSLTPLFPAPNFPSYPSNHSVLSTARAEVLAYLFPDRADVIRAVGKEAGDSRIWAGIHFPMDNDAGVTLGKQVAGKFIEWAENDGSQN